MKARNQTVPRNGPSEAPEEAAPPTLADIKAAAFEGTKEALEVHSAVQPAVYNSRQAATYLNVSARTLDSLVSAGKLRPLYIGRKRLFSVAQLDAFLRQAVGRRT